MSCFQRNQLKDMIAILDLMNGDNPGSSFPPTRGAIDVRISSIGGPKGYYLVIALETEEMSTTSTCNCQDG